MRGWMGQEFPTLSELHASSRAEQIAGWESLAESQRLCREAQEVPHAFDEGDLGHHAGRCALCDGLRRQDCHTA